MGFDYRTPTGLGKQALGGTKQTNKQTNKQKKKNTCVQQYLGNRSSDPTRDCLRLAFWMSRNLPWRHRSTVACREVRTLTTTVVGAEVCWHKSFWRTLSSLLSLSLPYLASVQTMRRNHSPTHQQKFELKIYWAWPCPPEQDCFPHSQSRPSGGFLRPLILIHQRADRMKSTITEN